MHCGQKAVFAVESGDGLTHFACERHVVKMAWLMNAKGVTQEISGPTCSWKMWSVADILKDALRIKEWTQKQLAEMTDIPEKSMSMLATGKKRLTPATAAKVGAALDLEPLDLLVAQADRELHLHERANPGQAETIRGRVPQATNEQVQGIPTEPSVVPQEST